MVLADFLRKRLKLAEWSRQNKNSSALSQIEGLMGPSG